MIEIGQKSEFELTYHDAVMYCFCLGEGWRLPTWSEYYNFDNPNLRGSWHLDDPLNVEEETFTVTPVRDLKDD
jgi:hypothetical protein